jgi:hypothetical protein
MVKPTFLWECGLAANEPKPPSLFLVLSFYKISFLIERSIRPLSTVQQFGIHCYLATSEWIHGLMVYIDFKPAQFAGFITLLKVV